jgi:RNA polymerase sigma-70 factor, ECF subfamily
MPLEARAANGAEAEIAVDPESAEWVRTLRAGHPQQHAALIRLHALLLRIARREVLRRGAATAMSAPDTDDLAHQAAADAMLAITAKLGTFRGESRFTTWAYRFVSLEVSGKIGRVPRQPAISLDQEDWDRLPDRFGLRPDREAERRDLVGALRRVVDAELSERQRRIFVALAVDAVPMDVLVLEYRTNRNAIYKTMFDARRKVRAALVADGYLDQVGTGFRLQATEG